VILTHDTMRALAAAVDRGEARAVGEMAPIRETKWTGWRVYLWGGRLYAVVTSGGDLTDTAEEIRPELLAEYVDDAESARAALASPSGEGAAKGGES
jgi:hypothetical protein